MLSTKLKQLQVAHEMLRKLLEYLEYKDIPCLIFSFKMEYYPNV